MRQQRFVAGQRGALPQAVCGAAGAARAGPCRRTPPAGYAPGGRWRDRESVAHTRGFAPPAGALLSGYLASKARRDLPIPASQRDTPPAPARGTPWSTARVAARFAFASDKRRDPPAQGSGQSGGHLPHTRAFINPHGLGDSRNGVGTHVVKPEKASACCRTASLT